MHSKGLIVHDIDDLIVLYSEGKKINNNWKNASLVETKNLGHGLQNKDVFNKIVSFISE
jgi:predicted alpha/beta hydrolase family esterase